MVGAEDDDRVELVGRVPLRRIEVGVTNAGNDRRPPEADDAMQVAEGEEPSSATGLPHQEPVAPQDAAQEVPVDDRLCLS